MRGMGILRGMGAFGIVLISVAFILINPLIGGLATEYVVEFWASYLKGVPVNIPFLPCIVAGLFFGEITIPAAVATWILSFVL